MTEEEEHELEELLKSRVTKHSDIDALSEQLKSDLIRLESVLT
jgi:hypothetical protein